MGLILVVVLLVVAALVVTTLLRPGPPGADVWAERHGLQLTPRTREMVTWYLRTASALRTAGVAAGFFIPPLATWSLGLSRALTFPYWTWVFLGYLGGAIYAEVSLVRRGDPAHRVATLARRELNEYLAPTVLAAQRALGGVAVVLAAAIAVVPNRTPPHQSLDRAPAVVVAVTAALFAVALEVVERWLVTRPQPFDAPDLVAADDAIRSTSLHAVAGSGLAVLLLSAGAGCIWLGGSDVQVLRWTMWVPGVLAWFAALFCCLRFAHRPWRVVRPQAAHA